MALWYTISDVIVWQDEEINQEEEINQDMEVLVLNHVEITEKTRICK